MSRRICTRCVMDTSDPGIDFDSDGVCNHCHLRDRMVEQAVSQGPDGDRQLALVVDEIRRFGANKPYDCVIGVSGGVDSTYVAWKVKSLGLRPLAVHLDNGWNSEIAVSNIVTVLNKVGIDLHTEVLDWEEFKDIQLAFLRASVPDAEVPSDHAIFACLYKTATRIGVKHVVTGLNHRTETHMPSSWSRGHLDWGYIKAIHKSFGSGRKVRTFPHYSFFQYVNGFRRTHKTVNILDYGDYSKKEALVFLEQELGWRDYGGKHHESVYTRWYQGVYLPNKFGFDKRRCHLSSRICSGELTREQALLELKAPPYDPIIQKEDTAYVAKKLGISSAEFESIMKAQPRKFEDFDSYEKIVTSPEFTRLKTLYQFIKYRLLRFPVPGRQTHPGR